MTEQPDGPAPLAMAMWDFSWLERRWPGAGYEVWERALDELCERGYDAVRIDPYPHLIAEGADQDWLLKPVWSAHEWGSPMLTRVRVMPALLEFVQCCATRQIKVGLSSWYREEIANVRMRIDSPEKMAQQWVATLAAIERGGLLDSIVYVDLCNEWPGALWAPYFRNDPPEFTWGGWFTERSMDWMRRAVAEVRRHYPALPVGFSFEPKKADDLLKYDVSYVDYLEPHIWMAQLNGDEFCGRMNFIGDDFSNGPYEILAQRGEALYREVPDHWNALLTGQIRKLAEHSARLRRPLMTTECWAVVWYKDATLLDWGWIKDICAAGVATAASSRRWLAIATSNFCGPQFRGMWRDVAWHRAQTKVIKASGVATDLETSRLWRRIRDVCGS